MPTVRNWQTAAAPVEGYIVPLGEGAEHPFFKGGASGRPAAGVLAGTASTGGLIAVEEGVLEPGQPGPYRHYHLHVAELFYVLDGEILLQIGGHVEQAGPGTFAFCPTGCVHAFRALGSEPARVLIMAMPPGQAEGYFRELDKLPREASEAEWEALGKKWGTIVVGPPLESDADAPRYARQVVD